MSRAESFLRGGTPCTKVPELIEVLGSGAGTSYTHWRFVAYYPQRWLHDAVENRTTAPVFFLVFAAAAATGSGQGKAADGSTAGEGVVLPHQIDIAAWHLLCHTVLPSGALPHESFQYGGVGDNGGDGGAAATAGTTARVTTGGGGVGALRALLHTMPPSLHPCASIEWLSVADGVVYERMGLMSTSVFEGTVAPAVSEVLHKCWKPRGGVATGVEAEEEKDAASPMASAHYVHDSYCASTIDLMPQNCGAAACRVAKRADVDTTVQPFVVDVVRAAVQWTLSSTCLRSFTADASVPSLPEECRGMLYPIMARLPTYLYTSMFVEAAHVDADPSRAPLVDPETLTGLAKLRAERDAGIAEWKKKIGEYASFTLPDTSVTSSSSATAASTTTATSTATSTATTRPFQHVVLLQRPIEQKRHIDVDNRDPGPLEPQPIGAELHLLQDRGDVQYTLEQLGNRSNIHFVYADTLPDDGEVLVQLTPVEGTPFCDLEAYFQALPADAPVFHAAPASQCAGSCCGVVVPRVLFRRPTGKTEKANPIATAQTAVEVLPPTTKMVAAAVAALKFVGAHAQPIDHNGSNSAPATSLSTPPCPGYTLTVPPVDLTLLPTKKCGWCGRRREVLLRCGGCKTVMYCSKRHQALDWKEGAHKVECKQWRRARELHECVVEPWAARTSLTWYEMRGDGDTLKKEQMPKGNGWSCAATLVQFIKDVEAEATRHPCATSRSDNGDVLNIHVAGLDPSCLDEFLRASAELFACFSHDNHQYRVLLCCDTFSDAQRNAVWAVRRCLSSADAAERVLWRTPNTGVLGDAWHCQGHNEAATRPAACVALLRCCGVKYHSVDRGSTAESGERPTAVLSFGPFNGEGCTYLTAALEVFAAQDVGMVPLRLVDSSYVGAVRTRDALAARMASSDVCKTSIKTRASALVLRAKERENAEVKEGATAAYMASGRRGHDEQHQPFLVLFNDDGAIAREVTTATTEVAGPVSDMDGTDGAVNDVDAGAGEARREARAGGAVPHYVNSYLFDAYPSDF